MTRLLLAVCLLGACTATAPRATQPILESEVRALLDGFGGDVGVYIEHLPTGAVVAINADTVFPTASLIKVPILLTLFDRIERGEYTLHQRVKYPDTLTYAYTEASDVVGYMQAGDSLPLSEVAFLMLSVSDNHASLWLQSLVTGAGINRWLDAHGFERTRMNSRTPGREERRTLHGWGESTPREMARMLTMIRRGEAVSPSASERMYRLLTKSYWDGEALSQIPPTVQAASKQGFVSRARSEVVLVNAPRGDYVIAVMTKNQTDTSDAPENEGFRLIRAVSRLAWERYGGG